jgi:hypothetical protein
MTSLEAKGDTSSIFGLHVSSHNAVQGRESLKEVTEVVNHHPTIDLLSPPTRRASTKQRRRR